jgi:hypothetical protein
MVCPLILGVSKNGAVNNANAHAAILRDIFEKRSEAEAQCSRPGQHHRIEKLLAEPEMRHKI